MNEQLKPNDAFVAYLSNPNASIMDYAKNGITANNTQLLNLEDYKNTPLIKKTFTKDNIFNEGAFKTAYEAAKEKYFEMGDDEALQNFLNWSPVSSRRPVTNAGYETSFSITHNDNPYQLSKSLKGFNAVGEPTKTEEELAQSGKIWDSDNQKWIEGKTAESQSFWTKMFGKSLVYAQYDHDGIQINPVTKESGFHYKGEWMKDENGHLFTMTIGKEDLGDKRIVSVSDILSKEDSKLNKIDFFDSDGFNKSIGGIAMKSAISMLPYLIPGVNTYYGALTAAVGVTSVLPTFFKALDSIITGDLDTGTKTAATQMENWFRKFEPSMSRHGQESFFSVESLGNLLADVFGQLHQQQAAGSLVKLFKTKPELAQFKTFEDWVDASKKWNETQKTLALAYMGLISTSNVYNDAIKGGYDSRTAGMAALASAGALFGIMNFNETAKGIGTWFLNKSTGFEQGVERSTIIKAVKNNFSTMQKALQEAKFGDSTALNKCFGSIWATAKSKMQDIFIVGGESIWKNAIVEGVEEVSEEVVQDTVKGIVDALSYLGYTGKKGSFGGWDNVFSKEGLSRYLQTLAGGALGGAVFDLQMKKIDPAMRRLFIDPNYKSPFETNVNYDLLDIVFDGREDEAIKEFENLRKIFNTKKGPLEYTGVNEENKNVTYNVITDNKQKTQADVIIDACIANLKQMSELVRGQFGITNFKSVNSALRNFIHTQYAEAYRSQGLLDYSEQKLKNILRDTYESYTNWQSKLTQSLENKEISKEEVKQAEEIFKYHQQKSKDFFSGKESIQTLLEMQISGFHFINKDESYNTLAKLDFDSWYNMIYRQEHSNIGKFETLKEGNETDSDFAITKVGVKKQYDAYVNSASETNTPKRAKILAETYLALQKFISSDITAYLNNKYKEIYAKDVLNYDLAPDEDMEKAKQMAKLVGEYSTMGKINPYAFSLNHRLKFDLASLLEEKGIVDLSEYEDKEIINIIKKLINATAAQSNINIFNKDTIRALFLKVNKTLSDPTNIYHKGIVNAYNIAQNKKNEAKATNNEEVEEDSFINISADAESQLNNKEIQLNLALVDDEIEQIKYKSITDLINDDEAITPEHERFLANYVSAVLINTLNQDQVLETLVQSKPFQGMDVKELEKKFFNSIKSTLLTNHNLFVKSAELLIEAIKGKIADEIGESSREIDLGELTNFLMTSPLFKNFDAKLTELYNQFKGKIVLDENPLQKAFEKIHFALTQSEDGKTLYDYIFKKESDIQTSDFTGDTLTFTEAERNSISTVMQTLDVLNTAISGMYTPSEVQNNDDIIRGFGINQIQKSYLNAYEHGDGAEDYLTLDENDYQIISKEISQLRSKFEVLKAIDSELTQSKNLVYDNLRKIRNQAHILFYKSDYLKTFKIDLPDHPEVNLLEGFDSEQGNRSNEEFIRDAEEAICTNLRNLFNTFTQNPEKTGSREYQFIQYLISGIKQMSVHGTEEIMPIEDFLVDGIPSWDALKCTQNGEFSFINGTYLLQKLFKMLYFSPKEKYNLLNTLYTSENNSSISPRIDQEEALINIEFALQYQDKLNDLLEAISNEEQNIPRDSKLIKKQLLKNVSFILGSGGSGKTLLLSLISNYHKNDNIVVSAMNAVNVNNLKEKTGREGDTLYNLFTNLSDINTSFEDACDEINKFITQVLSEKKDLATEPTPTDAAFVLENVIEDGQNKKYIFLYKNEPKNLQFRYIYNSKLNDSPQAEKFEFDNEYLPNIINSTIVKDNSILLIDECTQLSPITQHILSKYAQDHNIKIIEAGDPIQPGWEQPCYRTNSTDNKLVLKTIAYDLSEYRGFMAANLFGMWRADITVIQEVISKLYQIYSTPQGIKQKSIFNYSLSEYLSANDYEENIIPEIKTLPLNYSFEPDSDIPVKGFIINAGEDIALEGIKLINDKLSENNHKNVIIISDDSTITAEDIKKDFPTFDVEKWDIKTISEVQGNEYDNVVLYNINLPQTGYITNSKLAFMLLTRGKHSVISLESGELFTRLAFPTSSKMAKISAFQAEVRDKIANDALSVINNLAQTSKDIEAIKKEPIAVQQADIDEASKNLNNADEKVIYSEIPNFLPTSEDDEESNNSNKVEQNKTNWTKAGFNDAQQIGYWYTRLGIDWTNKDKLPEFKTLVEDADYTDLHAFAKIIQLLSEGKTDGDLENIKAQLDNLNLKIYSNINNITTIDLINAFYIYKQYLQSFIKSGQFKTFACHNPNASNIENKPFYKWNNHEEEINPSMTGGIFFIIPSENGPDIKYHITCGAFNNNVISEGNYVSSTLHSVYNKDAAKFKYFEKGIKEGQQDRHNTAAKKLTGINHTEKSAIFQNSGSIQLKIQNSTQNEELLNYLNPNDKNALEDLNYGRVSLENYIKPGYELVTSMRSGQNWSMNENGFMVFTGTNEERQKAFLNWIETFRFTPFDKNNKNQRNKLASLYDRTWIVVKQKGTNIYMPVLVSSVISKLSDRLNQTNDDIIWNPKQINKREIKILNEFIQRQIIQSILHSYNTDIEQKFKQLTKVNYDGNVFNNLDIIIKFVNDLKKDLIKIFNSEPQLQNEFNHILDSWVNVIQWSAFWNYYYTKYPGNTDAIKKTRSEMANKDINYKNIQNLLTNKLVVSSINQIKNLIDYIDKKLPSYFYTKVNIDKKINPKELKIERIYEPPHDLWDFEAMSEFTGKESSEESGQGFSSESDEDPSKDIKNLCNDILTIDGIDKFTEFETFITNSKNNFSDIESFIPQLVKKCILKKNKLIASKVKQKISQLSINYQQIWDKNLKDYISITKEQLGDVKIEKELTDLKIKCE